MYLRKCRNFIYHNRKKAYESEHTAIYYYLWQHFFWWHIKPSQSFVTRLMGHAVEDTGWEQFTMFEMRVSCLDRWSYGRWCGVLWINAMVGVLVKGMSDVVWHVAQCQLDLSCLDGTTWLLLLSIAFGDDEIEGHRWIWGCIMVYPHWPTAWGWKGHFTSPTFQPICCAPIHPPPPPPPPPRFWSTGSPPWVEHNLWLLLYCRYYPDSSNQRGA